MGRTIYFSAEELAMLKNTCTEYIEMMSEATETGNLVQEYLESGLGSAMAKLYKGTRLEALYSEYKKNKN